MHLQHTRKNDRAWEPLQVSISRDQPVIEARSRLYSLFKILRDRAGSVEEMSVELKVLRKLLRKVRESCYRPQGNRPIGDAQIVRGRNHLCGNLS